MVPSSGFLNLCEAYLACTMMSTLSVDAAGSSEYDRERQHRGVFYADDPDRENHRARRRSKQRWRGRYRRGERRQTLHQRPSLLEKGRREGLVRRAAGSSRKHGEEK